MAEVLIIRKSAVYCVLIKCYRNALPALPLIPSVLLSFATHYLLKGENGNTGTVSVFLRFGKHIFFAVDGKLLLEFLVVCRLEVVYIAMGIKTVIVYLYHTYRYI